MTQAPSRPSKEYTESLGAARTKVAKLEEAIEAGNAEVRPGSMLPLVPHTPLKPPHPTPVLFMHDLTMR